MFAPKVKEGEREYKNEIMVWDQWFNHPTLSSEEREKIRLSDVELGHVWMGFDPAETNLGFRQERWFEKGVVKGEKSIRFSIYNDIYQFFPEGLPNYGFLDDARCCHRIRNKAFCGNKAKFEVITENGSEYYCGTHSNVKKHPKRKELLFGRSKQSKENDDSKWKQMNEYHNVNRFLDTLDFSEVRFIIIESQMSINYRSTRMSQHIISSLKEKLKQYPKYFPIIFEIASKIKSRVFGVQLPKPELKKWTVRKAILKALQYEDYEFLHLVVQEEYIEILIQKYKCDDLTEGVLWDMTEPERHFSVKKEREKAKKEKCILAKNKGDDLYDICDAKEEIDAVIEEIGLSSLYKKKKNMEELNVNEKNMAKQFMGLPPLQ